MTLKHLRAVIAWCGLATLITIPIAVAANSEYLQYRGPIYIAAGFAGIVALAVLLVQPLLAAGLLPRLPIQLGRVVHRWSGLVLLLAIAAHVVGLWITSPPDMIDALTFRAPTLFSVFGVVGMWALLAAALLAAIRKKRWLRPQVWRFSHVFAASAIVAASVSHAMLIEGTMGALSKAALCAAVLCALIWTVWQVKPWRGVRRRQNSRR